MFWTRRGDQTTHRIWFEIGRRRDERASTTLRLAHALTEQGVRETQKGASLDPYEPEVTGYTNCWNRAKRQASGIQVPLLGFR